MWCHVLAAPAVLGRPCLGGRRRGFGAQKTYNRAMATTIVA